MELPLSDRISMQSVKNFMLIEKSSGGTFILLEFLMIYFTEGNKVMEFGKCGQDMFCLEALYPLAPIEAIAIALTTFEAYH